MDPTSSYEVILHRRATRALERLPRNLAERALSILEELRENPFSGDVRAVRGYVNVFRRRAGKLRVVYYVDFENRRVVVLGIGFREHIYEGL